MEGDREIGTLYFFSFLKQVLYRVPLGFSKKSET